MSDFAAIPDELRERDQWICWKEGTRNGKVTKIPMQADASGNARTNDPETWGAFEQAVDTARGRDSWGIGFVFSDTGPYAGIDLDDCLNDRGGPADWLPSLELFTEETYIEQSPSGDGLHVIVEDANIPEWWTNQHGEDDGREVAVFDETRFFTFTGKAIDVSTDEVAEIEGLDEWLLDAWDVFNDAPPQTSDSREDDEPRSRDLSRKSREDIDVRVTGVVHAGYTPGERHEHPVHGSTTGSNFLVDEDDETFRCWRHDVTGNALHLVGMQEGIIDCGDWRRGGLDTETWADIFEAARDRGLDVPDRPEPPSVEEAEREGWLDWSTVREFYESEDFSTQQARQAAVRYLLSEHDFMTPRDTAAIWVYNAERGIFEKDGDTQIETLLENNLGSYYTQHEKREILGKVRAATYCDRDEFDGGADDRELLCVGNGVLDLEERELLNHSPEFRFTRGLPVEYDPDAEPEKIESFMDDITRRPEDKETMYEMLGNSLAPHYDHSAFLILFGEGANGKSTFFDVAEEMLGSQNVSGWGLQELEDNRFATSSLPGKFANIAPDLPSKSITQTGTIKALTGGDTVMVEEKGEPAYEFVNNAKLMFGANRPPVIQEASMAIKRRILPIHLPKQFTHQDDGNPDARPKHKLVADLTAAEELSGLLNRALDALDRLRETGQFSLPESPEERLEYYEQFSDPIKEFAINCIENEHGEWLPKSAVYEAFKQFSAENDYAIRSRSVFFRQLRQVSTFTYNEFQPRNDDGGRTRGLKGATLSAEGLQYCDEMLLEELGLAEEVDDDDDADTPTVTTDLGDVAPEGNPFYDVEVTVNKMRAKDKGPAYEGSVSDGTATLEFVDWFGLPGLGDLDEGATYQFTDVKAAYDSDGALHLQPVENTTEWSLVETERSKKQASLDSPADSPPEPQGEDTEEPGIDASDADEPEDTRKLVVQLATAKARKDSEPGVARDTLIEALVERGVEPSTAEHEVDKALREGRLHEPKTARYRST